MTTNRSNASRTSILRALLLAGLLLAGSAALELLWPDHLDPDLARRLWQVMMGAVVVVYANAAPKALSPLIRMRCDPATEQAVRRFAGWSLTLGGAGYSLAWMIAPMKVADVLSTSLLATALLLALLRGAWAMKKGLRT